MYFDCRGLTITADNDAAVAAHDRMMADYLIFSVDTGDSLKAVFQADPDMVMAHCMRGYFFQLFYVPVLMPRAEKALGQARASAAARGATAREERHITALDAWCRGDLLAATAAWDAILDDDPLDLMALRMAQYIHFYTTGGATMLRSSARTAAVIEPDTPGYGYALGVHAFSHEECGDYEQAERLGREAVAATGDDIWGTHAVTHVMEMQGRHAEGIEWITGLEKNFPKANNFAFHLWWHRCLFYLEQERYDEVLARYDGEIRVEETEEYLDLTNAAALLWRLEERGVDVGGRWRELADKCAARVEDGLLAFADAHFMTALVADGRGEAAQALLATIKQSGARAQGKNAGHQASVHREVGGPLCRAMLAQADGDDARFVALVAPIRDQIWRLGGSHAQRDLFAQMLIRATLEARDWSQARDLLEERSAAMPNSAAAWRNLAQALDGLGEADAASTARVKATTLLGV